MSNKKRTTRKAIRKQLRAAARPFDDDVSTQMQAQTAYVMDSAVVRGEVAEPWRDLPQWIRDSWVLDVMEIQL